MLEAYGLDHLEFGRDYIVPKPLDVACVLWEAPAVAQAAMQTGAARLTIDLDCYRDDLARRRAGKIVTLRLRRQRPRFSVATSFCIQKTCYS